MGRLMQPTAEVQLQPPGAPGPLVAGGGPNMYDMDDFYKNEHSFAHSFVSLYHGAARPTPLLRPRHIPRAQSVCVHSPCHGLVGPRLHPSTPGRFACYTPPRARFPNMPPLLPRLGAFVAHESSASRGPFGVIIRARSRPIWAERCGGCAGR